MNTPENDQNGQPQWIHWAPYDGQPHVPVSLSCWCRPKQDQEDPKLIIHSPQVLDPIQKIFDAAVEIGKNMNG